VTRSRRATAILLAFVVALSLAGVVLTILTWSDMSGGDAVSNVTAPLAGILYAALGVLVVRRAGNLIGWFLLGEGAGLAIQALASAYAILGIRHPGTVPAPALAGLLAECIFVPLTMGLGFTLLLFPTGRLPSRHWRPVAALGLLATALLLAGFVVRPRLLELPAPGGESALIANPLGDTSLGPVPSIFLIGSLNGLSVVFTLLFAASLSALVVRYRSGGREVRQQIKWLACAALATIACQVVALVALAASGGVPTAASVVAYAVLTVVVLLGVPAVITLAILKYGLYQIDVIINRAVVYGLLSAALTAVYAGIVVGIGTLAGYAGGPVLTVSAAVVIAVLFGPLRHRAQLIANRVVYGQRATPYQVLADFAEDMAGQLEVDVALDRMAAVLAAATGAVRVEVWIRIGAQLRPRVTWPSGTSPSAPVALNSTAALPAFDAPIRAIAVRHGPELLGAISIAKPKNEPVSAAEDRLLTHLASQAGLALRNVRLTAELQASIDDLRASRRRLVKAQDEERRRIERNLHDGAQQQLVALSVHLGLLADAAGDPDEIGRITADLRSGLQSALDDLRALARGIYPPLLADQGLESALRAQAGKAPLPVQIDADGIGRYPRDAEATVYFCILEALQNTAKYARASCATVALRGPDGRLEFTVTDDGAGFDPATVTDGSGLQGMADRLAAVGGGLQVLSAPGLGTTISGTLPVAELASTGS
jgi:signal transduction histidine kinase